jgi:hypothetical protein
MRVLNDRARQTRLRQNRYESGHDHRHGHQTEILGREQPAQRAHKQQTDNKLAVTGHGDPGDSTRTTVGERLAGTGTGRYSL